MENEEGFRMKWKNHVQSFNERWDIVIPGNGKEAVAYAVLHFMTVAKESIAEHGHFAVALSGGNTPKAIYEGLAKSEDRNQVDWKRVLLFWGDERSVPPTHSDSNYKLAMESGLASLPILKKNVFRMPAEDDIEEEAKKYEALIKEKILHKRFDLVMLGMGEDGHTASLFPKTHGLHADDDRLVIANYVPQKETWRMTLTYHGINTARNICIYILGKGKAEMVARIFNGSYDPDNLPIQRVGTPTNKALWIMDEEAASLL
jgi:6-phosphogluconolactonase